MRGRVMVHDIDICKECHYYIKPKGELNMVNRIDLTKREDGYIVSTVKPTFMAWFGKYETAIMFEGRFEWRIAEGYETEEEARIGHEKYVNMSADEIEKIAWIG